jgi:hypothetical protein
MARAAAAAGFITIADGTFLRRWQRDMFRGLADELGIPFVILSTRSNEATLRERIAARQQRHEDPSEADLAVLDHQIKTREEITEDEASAIVVCDADAPLAEAAPAARAAVLAHVSRS